MRSRVVDMVDSGGFGSEAEPGETFQWHSRTGFDWIGEEGDTVRWKTKEGVGEGIITGIFVEFAPHDTYEVNPSRWVQITVTKQDGPSGMAKVLFDHQLTALWSSDDGLIGFKCRCGAQHNSVYPEISPQLAYAEHLSVELAKAGYGKVAHA